MIIKGILFIIIFPLILVLLGDKFLRYVGWNRSLPASFIWGYVLILALFQFIAFPLFRLNSSFSLLFWIITLLIGSSIIWIIIEIVYKQKKSKEFVFKTYKQGIIVFFRNCRLYPFLAVLLLLCILFCIFMSEGFYYSSSDEGYNIPRALETIAQNSLGINDVLSWRGIYTNDAAPYSNASTYYFFIAWLSCIFGIHTTVLYKTFLLFILIFLRKLLTMNLSMIPRNVAIIAMRKSMILEKSGWLIINRIETRTKNATILTLIIWVASEKMFLYVLRGLYSPNAKYKII